jgi:glycine oxidase ThiO
VTDPHSADAIILGGGLVGLCCAAALRRDGASTILLDERRAGASSRAAAGMLAPSIDRASGPASDFAIRARDRYPEFLAWLEGETGRRVPLNSSGILQVALTEAGVRGLRRAMTRDPDGSAEWLDAVTVRDVEPALDHALGAVFHPLDGAVDNVALMSSLEAYCRSASDVALVDASGIALGVDGSALVVRASNGNVYRARHVILASGAWASSMGGLPRAIPVSPLRGQMLAYHGSPLRHVVFGPRGYIVPRRAGDVAADGAGETLVGATSERVAFDVSTTSAAGDSLRRAAAEILPSLTHRDPARHWAGLRPMTPDLLPIIGPDPDLPSLLYACGHSRNGILMAPLTAECLSALVRGVPLSDDLQPFSIARFSRD